MIDWLSWDVLRWVNLIGAMLVVSLLIMGAMRRWPEMPVRFKRITPWIIATYVVIAYGSGEALAQDVEPGYRIILMMCVLLGLIVALLYRMSDSSYKPGRLSDDARGLFHWPWHRRR